jgi:hypothetical protein
LGISTQIFVAIPSVCRRSILLRAMVPAEIRCRIATTLVVLERRILRPPPTVVEALRRAINALPRERTPQDEQGGLFQALTNLASARQTHRISVEKITPVQEGPARQRTASGRSLKNLHTGRISVHSANPFL